MSLSKRTEGRGDYNLLNDKGMLERVRRFELPTNGLGNHFWGSSQVVENLRNTYEYRGIYERTPDKFSSVFLRVPNKLTTL